MSMNLFEFWEKIELPSKVKEKVLKLELEEKEYLDICHIYQESHENYYQFLLEKEESALWFLLIYSRMACEVYDKYSALGISEDVFWATFKDITFWCKNYEQEYGQIGLGAYEWFHRHIDMTLFRLGRLQFEPMVMESTVGDGIETIPEGTSVINIHIPQGEPLIWSECEKSIQQAQRIWGDEIPYVCHSWLLYPDLKEILSEKSNIREFSKHFHVLQIDFKEREAEWRIFGKVLKNISEYPEKTNLQKSAKEYLLRGKCLGNGWSKLNTKNGNS